MLIQYWKVDPEMKKEAEENYRTSFAMALKGRTPLEIIRELTFDSAAPNIVIEDVEKLFDHIEKYFLRRSLSGVGLEVGAGPLTFSSILAKRPGVEKVYGVEICQPVVDELFPKVAESILGPKSQKVIGVVGNFDAMELPDNSVDFVFDFFSLHHSLDINVTLKELYRVLKPGGFVLCLDKGRPNKFNQADLDELMDKVYEEDHCRQFGLPLDTKMTRRENGEREYRLKDWQAAFGGAGFTTFDNWYFDKPTGKGFAVKIKKLIAKLSPSFQNLLMPLIPAPRFGHKFILETNNRVFVNEIIPFRKEMSLMVAYK